MTVYVGYMIFLEDVAQMFGMWSDAFGKKYMLSSDAADLLCEQVTRYIRSSSRDLKLDYITKGEYVLGVEIPLSDDCEWIVDDVTREVTAGQERFYRAMIDTGANLSAVLLRDNAHAVESPTPSMLVLPS